MGTVLVWVRSMCTRDPDPDPSPQVDCPTHFPSIPPCHLSRALPSFKQFVHLVSYHVGLSDSSCFKRVKSRASSSLISFKFVFAPRHLHCPSVVCHPLLFELPIGGELFEPIGQRGYFSVTPATSCPSGSQVCDCMSFLHSPVIWV